MPIAKPKRYVTFSFQFHPELLSLIHIGDQIFKNLNVMMEFDVDDVAID